MPPIAAPIAGEDQCSLRWGGRRVPPPALPGRETGRTIRPMEADGRIGQRTRRDSSGSSGSHGRRRGAPVPAEWRGDPRQRPHRRGGSHFEGLPWRGKARRVRRRLVVEWSTDYGDGRVYRNVTVADLARRPRDTCDRLLGEPSSHLRGVRRWRAGSTCSPTASGPPPTPFRATRLIVRARPTSGRRSRAETAAAKVQAAEDAWNTRDPDRVALACTEDSEWRNRDEFLDGRDEIAPSCAASGRGSGLQAEEERSGIRREPDRRALRVRVPRRAAASGAARTATRTGSSTRGPDGEALRPINDVRIARAKRRIATD